MSHRAFARMHTLKDRNCNIEHIVQAMLDRTEEVTGVKGVDYDREKLIWLWHNTTLEDEFIHWYLDTPAKAA